MAPQKKSAKSKDTKKPSVTLHQFFTSPASGSSKAPNVPKSAQKTTSSGTRHNKRNSLPNPREVIVIDSDSDHEIEVAAARPLKKKRRLSASYSDVELLESEPAERVNSDASETPRIPKSAVIAGPALNFGKPSSLLETSSTKHDVPETPCPSVRSVVPMLSFGKPSALLEPPLNSTRLRRDLTNEPPALSLDTPSLLIAQPSLDAADCPSPAIAERNAGIDFGGDEWGMGDDEQAVSLEEDDDDEATQIDDPVDIMVSSCPLCSRSLNELSEAESQAHVNACLDADAVPRPESSKTPLKPLSSIPVPKAGGKENGCNAFSVLMTSRAEMAVWNEAAEAEASRASKNNRRKAPFYKVMEGMPIAVDAFRYGAIPNVAAYFLTHAHSDHYTNLSSSWKHGPIYCSEGTANLIIHLLSVDKKWVHPLPMDVPTLVPNTGGVHVTLIEANHCPGSCLFLFEGKQTVHAGDSNFKSPWVGSPRTFRYLHCGDFRASPQHTLHPAVQGKHLDHVYLDTTYLDPRYTFPPQPLVISACAQLAERIAAGKASDGDGPKMDKWVTPVPGDPKGKQKAQPERILMVVGTYSVGKERIVKAVAQAINSKIFCDFRKAAILRCQSDPELHALLTDDALAADVHILPLGSITLEKLQMYLERFKGAFTKVVGFRPTGWTYSPPAGAVQSPSIASVIVQAQQKPFTYANLRPARSSTATLQLFPVPYSEHSSFFELTCFALSLQWGRMIATVNVGSERSRARMTGWMKKWEAEKKKQKKGEIVPHRQSDYW